MTNLPQKIAEWLSELAEKVGILNQKDIKKGAIYEIYSLEEGKRIELIDGSDKAFENDWDAPFYPFSTLIFNENPDENYGTPDVKIYEPQQKELNKCRTLQMKTIDRNNPRWQTLKNSVSAEEKKKFEENIISSLIEVGIHDAIRPIPPISIDRNMEYYEPRIVNDIRECMGIDEVMKGGENATRKSATETATRDFYARLRIGDRKEIVDDLVKDVAEKQLWFMQKEYTIPRYISVVGADAAYLNINKMDEGQIPGKSFTGQFQVVSDREGKAGNLSGDFEISVRSSTYAQNVMVESQRLTSFLQFLAINPMINPKELTELVVKVGLDGFETSKLVVPDAYDIATDPLKAEKFREIMMGLKGGGSSPIGDPGSAGPGMKEAKTKSEAIQQPSPQRNTLGPEK